MYLFRPLLQYRGPHLRIGVNIGRLARYTRHELTVLSPLEFDRLKAPSTIWGMVRDDDFTSEDVDARTLTWVTTNAAAVKAARWKKRTWVVIDDKGHKYSTLIYGGQLSELARERYYRSGDYSEVIAVLLSCFAPSPRRDAWMTELPLEWGGQDEGYVPRALTQEELTPERIATMESLTALGSNIIERSHVKVSRQGRYLVIQYLASTRGFNHGLDGYAEHRHIVDLESGDILFQANGEGRHAIRTVDGINNPLAPFVFDVMLRSFFAWNSLLDERAKARREAGDTKPETLDILRKPQEAHKALNEYLRRTDKRLFVHRQLAWALDFASGLSRTARRIFGGEVVGAPSVLGKPRPKTGGGGGGGDTLQQSVAPILPFLVLLVYFLDDEPEEAGDDEPDYNSIFVALDERDRPIAQAPLKLFSDEEM